MSEEVEIDFKDLIKKIKPITKKWYFWPLIITALFFIIRLPLINTYQTYWWDESQYMLMVKHLFKGTTTSGWIPTRSMIHIWLLYFLTLPFGFNELAIKFVNLLFCLGFSLSTYFICKEVFDKKKGISAGIILACSWIILYWSLRINIDMLNSFLLTLSALFYIKSLNDKESKNALMAGLTLGLALTIRFTALVSGIIYLIHALIYKREIKQFVWILGVFIGYSPLAIQNLVAYGNPLHTITAFSGGSGVDLSFNNELIINNFTYYLTNILPSLGVIMGTLFFIGVVFAVLKITNKKVSFILFNIIIYLGFYITVGALSDLRFLIHLMPFLIIISLLGASIIFNALRIRKKTLYCGLIIITLIICTENLLIGVNSVQGAANTYLEVKQAAEFLKTYGEGKIMSNSWPQTAFYSEKETDYLPQNKTTFLNVINNYSFVIISLYEPHPDYAYELNHSFLIPIRVYPSAQDPRLVIYQVNKTN